jgi:hypothetical protein
MGMAAEYGRPPLGKRVGVVSAAIALVALGVGVVTPALSASRDDNEQRTIRLVAINTEADFVDLGAEGDTLGDYFVFTHKLLRRGEQVGHVSGQCTIVSVAAVESEPQCVVTASLPRGLITAQTLIGPHGATGDIVQAITGGSGRYTGAEGHILIQGVTDVKEIWTFHLED